MVFAKNIVTIVHLKCYTESIHNISEKKFRSSYLLSRIPIGFQTPIYRFHTAACLKPNLSISRSKLVPKGSSKTGARSSYCFQYFTAKFTHSMVGDDAVTTFFPSARSNKKPLNRRRAKESHRRERTSVYHRMYLAHFPHSNSAHQIRSVPKTGDEPAE